MTGGRSGHGRASLIEYALAAAVVAELVRPGLQIRFYRTGA